VANLLTIAALGALLGLGFQMVGYIPTFREALVASVVIVLAVHITAALRRRVP
jgi:hypothetical protein